MPRRRRSRTQPRTYSLAQLLSRQPRSLRKYSPYEAMMLHYGTSERLRRIRFSRRCYTLLNRARIRPENLRTFYRTYRLPADPFFPLFLAAKQCYLAERRRIQERRHQYILASMRSLPAEILVEIKYLCYLEQHYNAAGRSPVWDKELFPRTKKRVDAYSRYTTVEWICVFRAHLAALTTRYRSLSGLDADRALAAFVLGVNGAEIPPDGVPEGEVIRSYRRRSLMHHPDRGGDPAVFIELSWAKDVLLGRRTATA